MLSTSPRSGRYGRSTHVSRDGSFSSGVAFTPGTRPEARRKPGRGRGVPRPTDRAVSGYSGGSGRRPCRITPRPSHAGHGQGCPFVSRSGRLPLPPHRVQIGPGGRGRRRAWRGVIRTHVRTSERYSGAALEPPGCGSRRCRIRTWSSWRDLVEAAEREDIPGPWPASIPIWTRRPRRPPRGRRGSLPGHQLARRRQPLIRARQSPHGRTIATRSERVRGTNDL